MGTAQRSQACVDCVNLSTSILPKRRGGLKRAPLSTLPTALSPRNDGADIPPAGARAHLCLGARPRRIHCAACRASVFSGHPSRESCAWTLRCGGTVQFQHCAVCHGPGHPRLREPLRPLRPASPAPLRAPAVSPRQRDFRGSTWRHGARPRPDRPGGGGWLQHDAGSHDRARRLSRRVSGACHRVSDNVLYPGPHDRSAFGRRADRHAGLAQRLRLRADRRCVHRHCRLRLDLRNPSAAFG